MSFPRSDKNVFYFNKIMLIQSECQAPLISRIMIRDDIGSCGFIFDYNISICQTVLPGHSVCWNWVEIASLATILVKFQALKLNDDQSVPILVNKHFSGDVKSQVLLVMKFEERFPSVMSRFNAKLRKILHIQYFNWDIWVSEAFVQDLQTVGYSPRYSK